MKNQYIKIQNINWFLPFVFITILITSCKESDTTENNFPANLRVNITLSETEYGKVIIQAIADNTEEYSLYIDAATEPEETNTTGNFEYTFPNAGSHMVEVRAYGNDNRYVKAERTVIIPGGPDIEDGWFSPLEYDGMSMVWNDEFDGALVNQANWTFETGNGCPNNCGWGNNELEYYRKENAWTEDGVLIIEARKEAFQGSNYTSARMITRDKKSFLYGRIDIRAALPKGQGLWPALWMLGNSITSVGWPACGEIDIMEMVGGQGREKTVHGTLHWDDNGHVQAGGGYSLPSGTFADKYHVFSITWDESYIRWYVDDKQFHVIDIRPGHMSEFHQPHFIIFNVAVGGNWPGNPNTSTIFPQQMRVDYIRVFQNN